MTKKNMTTKTTEPKSAKMTAKETIRGGALGDVGFDVGAIYEGESPSDAIRRQVSWLTLHVHQMDQDIVTEDAGEVVLYAEQNIRHACEMLTLISLAVEDLENAAAAKGGAS